MGVMGLFIDVLLTFCVLLNRCFCNPSPANWQEAWLEQFQTSTNSPTTAAPGAANTTTFYIVPKSSEKCQDFGGSPYINVDPTKLDLLNSNDHRSIVLQFPGCMDIRAQVEILQPLPSFLIAYGEWSWLEAPAGADFSQLNCKNASSDGCGGFGNKCYYCDACNELQSAEMKSTIVRDYAFKCPNKTGVYEYRDQICIKDWGDLDKNHDGEPDFLNDPQFKDYKRLLDVAQVRGYGTMQLHFKIAHAGPDGVKMMAIRDQVGGLSDDTIQQMATDGSNGWVPKIPASSSVDKLRADYISFLEKKQGLGGRKWLAKMVAQNTLACDTVEFDVCDRPPSYARISRGDGSSCS